MTRGAVLTLAAALAAAGGCEPARERVRPLGKAWAEPEQTPEPSPPVAPAAPHAATSPPPPAPPVAPPPPSPAPIAAPDTHARLDEAAEPLPAALADTAAARPRPEEMLAPERESVRPGGAGHVCFSWRTGHRSSTQCYASVESCNAERRAAPAAEELTRCQLRSRASCTQIASDLGSERHCFGDAARCAVFRAELDPSIGSTPCRAE